ncbi:MAG: DUF2313 domain-containing protein [bacterium]|nr:DUF2313 domain-containing protein [bacterium]
MTSAIGQRMLTYLPGYYETSRVMQGVMEAQGAELDKVQTALDAVLDQCFVSTATWGLERWEQELGLQVNPPISDADRRSRIVARLRGSGTCTIRIVEQLAESFEHGHAEVIEDYPAYTVTISFLDALGQPPDLAQMQAELRELIPAHLAVEYQFNYFIWYELDGKGWSWAELDALGLTWDEILIYE